jgi:hypothetical protein
MEFTEMMAPIKKFLDQISPDSRPVADKAPKDSKQAQS